MEEKKHSEERKAWIIVDRGLERDARLKDKGIRLKGRHPALHEGAWVLVLAADGRIQRIGQVLRSISTGPGPSSSRYPSVRQA